MNNYDLWKWAAETNRKIKMKPIAPKLVVCFTNARCICRDHVVVLFNLCALELRENRQMRN